MRHCALFVIIQQPIHCFFETVLANSCTWVLDEGDALHGPFLRLLDKLHAQLLKALAGRIHVRHRQRDVAKPLGIRVAAVVAAGVVIFGAMVVRQLQHALPAEGLLRLQVITSTVPSHHTAYYQARLNRRDVNSMPIGQVYIDTYPVTLIIRNVSVRGIAEEIQRKLGLIEVHLVEQPAIITGRSDAINLYAADERTLSITCLRMVWWSKQYLMPVTLV